MAYKKIKRGIPVGEEQKRVERNRHHILENNFFDEIEDLHPEDRVYKKRSNHTHTRFEDPFIIKKDYGRTIVKELRELEDDGHWLFELGKEE